MDKEYIYISTIIRFISIPIAIYPLIMYLFINIHVRVLVTEGRFADPSNISFTESAGMALDFM